MQEELKSREQLLQELQTLREQLKSIQETQKIAVQQLQEERQIFLNGPTVVFQWKNAPGWPVKYASPNVKEVFGYSAEDFMKERISYAELVFSEDVERVTQEVKKASASGASNFEHLPYRILHKNKQIIWLYDFTTILRDESGAITDYLGYVSNITDRKLAEERYRSMTIDVLDKLEVGILIADAHNKVVWLNKKMNAFFGIPCTEILEQSRMQLFQQYIQPLLEDPKMMKEIYSRNIPAEKNPICHLLAKQGLTERWLEYRIQPISTGLYAGGQVELYYDITLLKNTEQERNQMELQMLHAQKLESLGILTGGIAHDFNNLLTGILGNAGFIRLNLPKDSDLESPLQDIESASTRAAELCKQMLAYSGKGKFLIQPINLNDLIREITHLLEISISKNVTIRYHFSLALPLIEADATQIRQIIMNLITNASDAIGEGHGEIIVITGVMHCSPESFEHFNFTEKREEGFYIFAEIRDTGSGINADIKKKIFDPFFTTKFAGRGLGLSAVLGIVRSHHGAIQVESVVGKGSCFRILFPYSSNVEMSPTGRP